MVKQVDSTKLIEAVDQKVDQVRTRTLDISFNELLDMYKEKELIIDPAYQRLFRWDTKKQSQFIESLILELPLPPIFVIERPDGAYELIDGLQRISSYLHFRGNHPERVNEDGTFHKLSLVGCDIVKQLDGLTYEEIPQALQVKLKRNFVRVEVLRKASDQRLRYYMFRRLNTGGEKLSEQEIRNCTVRLLNDRFNDFIISLSKNEDFKVCISNASPKELEQKQDQELVLRFFAFKNYRAKYVHKIQPFLTEYMEVISDPEKNNAIIFDYTSERCIFEKTFKVLNKALGANIFSKTNAQGNFVSKLFSYHYESFTLGIQDFLDSIDPDDDQAIANLRDVFVSIKNNEAFRKMTTGGGRNYASLLNERIDIVKAGVGKLYGSQ